MTRTIVATNWIFAQVFFFMYEFYLAYSMSPRAVGIKYDKYSCLYAWNSNYVHTPVCWQPLIKPYTYILGLLSWPMGTTKHDRNCFVTIVQTLYRCHFSPKTGKTKEKKNDTYTQFTRETQNEMRFDVIKCECFSHAHMQTAITLNDIVNNLGLPTVCLAVC